MKKLITICLIMATVFTVNAQDGKPTKEQTVEFIKSYFKDKTIMIDEFENDSYESREYQNVIIDFDYSTSIMIIQYGYEYNYRNAKLNLSDNQIYYYKYVFNLANIESIDYSFTGKGPYHLKLNLKGVPNKVLSEFEYTTKDEIKKFPLNGKDVKEVSFAVDIAYNVETTPEATKLQKAFNHLRKLCGAPDPISFD